MADWAAAPRASSVNNAFMQSSSSSSALFSHGGSSSSAAYIANNSISVSAGQQGEAIGLSGSSGGASGMLVPPCSRPADQQQYKATASIGRQPCKGNGHGEAQAPVASANTSQKGTGEVMSIQAKADRQLELAKPALVLAAQSGQPILVDMFAGTCSLSKAAQAAGWEVVPVDWAGSEHKPLIHRIDMDLTTSKAEAALFQILARKVKPMILLLVNV